jgi:pimeloyl-ACP methyl ester carboxylesterase
VHHFVSISEFPGSYLLAADVGPVETAVVFVHGFLGDAYLTWVDFQSRIDQESWWESVDLYFLDYDSFGESVGHSADVLSRLVERLGKAPADWFEVSAESLPREIRDSLGPFRLRSGATEYKQLVLVGHSLGGVVLRQTILSYAKRYIARLEEPGAVGVPVPIMLEAPLRLFAPAISGARTAGIAGIVMRLGGIRGFARAWLGGSPSYAELQPDGGVVGPLREETQTLATRFPDFKAFRADVLWAGRDDFVVDREYFRDHSCGRAEGKDHVSVCKPCLGYRQPLDLVTRGQI